MKASERLFSLLFTIIAHLLEVGQKQSRHGVGAAGLKVMQGVNALTW
jgi:hypothetical protein